MKYIIIIGICIGVGILCGFCDRRLTQYEIQKKEIKEKKEKYD